MTAPIEAKVKDGIDLKAVGKVEVLLDMINEEGMRAEEKLAASQVLIDESQVSIMKVVEASHINYDSEVANPNINHQQTVMEPAEQSDMGSSSGTGEMVVE
mmetsp:Transcript_6684/g.9136  ORF Transcript_6684/g.9136 Transcript_6684/m.9136 type:complete len:101 (+) Transcript_6684:323-625(+)|eukprot:CAMPEP_0185566720 /NCGR_PEP_ID=MMETSP0434-20130131/118_1 /TAXON_ID=626734 ORGANISM="Favella taraikaensis, Strain Fe Narragansett Bay" /NCGR_SAMPLE_ID=MMETSP0434 /ASSEMBLY_ACC=CAM_ASM_000379 /LENGTH=100 /DNA_ID=CAMNT_0028180707 /DNA_START=307 /DNA_END=609 /DNA_ORIENTATION=-